MKSRTTYVLRFVNRIRRAIGDPPLAELPTGRRSSAFQCPVARALGHGAAVCRDNLIVSGLTPKQKKALRDAHGLSTCPDGDTAVVVYCPPSVHDFIKAFDNGDFDELLDASAY